VLSEKEKQALRLHVEAELYRRSFYEFFMAASKVLYPQVMWEYPPFYQYICNILQAEVERIIRREEKNKDLIFTLPFRAGKSVLISQIFPVWCWLKQSSLAVMQISHSELLAVKHSHASLMLIECEWFKLRFPELELRVDSKAKANYMNNFGGKRISFGIGSGIIGEGCSIQICDDINQPSDSVANTHTINEIYTDTLYSRLNNAAIDLRIIMQQRVSQNDIVQYLLDTNPNKYNHICLPVRFSQDISPSECIKFYTNNLLWPERFSEKVIQDFQTTLGSRAFASQLMQQPVALEGNLIKRSWFKTIPLNDLNLKLGKRKMDWSMYIDTSYTSKQTNDATAILIAGKLDNIMYVLKCWKVWLEFPQLLSKLKEIQIQYNTRLMYIESKASGLSIKQQLQHDGFNVAELKAIGDKISRVNAQTPAMEGGRVILIEDSSNEMLLQEMAAFPFSSDDLVDVITYACQNLLNSGGFSWGM